MRSFESSHMEVLGFLSIRRCLSVNQVPLGVDIAAPAFLLSPVQVDSPR